MNIANIRQLSQQLAVPQYAEPHEVVRWFGFMQAQDYRMMRWAVAMRTRRPSIRAFARDYDEGRILRTHLFRCTWQLVCAEDLRWMLQLCKDKNLTSVKGWMKQYGHSMPTNEETERAFEAIRSILQGRQDVTSEELTLRMIERGINGDSHQLKIYLYLAEFEGIICSGILHPQKMTYALTEERIPQFSMPTRDEALALLARRYFQSHAPATMDDFAWWTGLPKGELRRATESLGDELMAETIDGQTYYLMASSRMRGCRAMTILLPSFDEYLIGYKTRHHVLDDDFRHRAFTNNGIFHPVILSAGKVVGNWHPQSHEVSFFRPEWETDTSALFAHFENSIKKYGYKKNNGV